MKGSYPSNVLVIALIALVLGGAVSVPPPVANAQAGGTITYGASVLGVIGPEAPLALYSFNAAQGDLVHISAVGLTGGLDPVVDLLAPDRQVLVTSQHNSLAADRRDVSIVFYVPQNGVYSLMLSGMNGTTGNFLLELQGRSAVTATPLVFGQALPIEVAVGAAPQYFTFTAQDCPTVFQLVNPSRGEPVTFPFVVKVRDDQAQLVATLRGGHALEDRVVVAPQSGSYEVEVWSDDPAVGGSLRLLVSCGDGAAMCLGSSSAAPTGGAAECPECPPCPDESPLCADFAISIDSTEGGTVIISWPAIEGADAAIISVNDSAGDLQYARMVHDTLTQTIDFYGWGADAGAPYTIRVAVGAEESGYSLCVDTTEVGRAPEGGSETDEDDGPVEWGPAADDPCEVAMVAPLETMANGLQTFFWTDVPEAESYRLRIYGQYDTVVAEGVIAAPATSLTLDVSEAAIGAGYGGENDFFAQIDVHWGGERQCVNGVRLTRNP